MTAFQIKQPGPGSINAQERPVFGRRIFALDLVLYDPSKPVIQVIAQHKGRAVARFGEFLLGQTQILLQ